MSGSVMGHRRFSRPTPRALSDRFDRPSNISKGARPTVLIKYSSHVVRSSKHVAMYASTLLDPATILTDPTDRPLAAANWLDLAKTSLDLAKCMRALTTCLLDLAKRELFFQDLYLVRAVGRAPSSRSDRPSNVAGKMWCCVLLA